MGDWQQQGAAWVRTVALVNGSPAKVVVVAERMNPKGAQVVLASTDGQPAAVPISQALVQLDPTTVLDILCFQERAFGDGRLPPVTE